MFFRVSSFFLVFWSFAIISYFQGAVAAPLPEAAVVADGVKVEGRACRRWCMFVTGGSVTESTTETDDSGNTESAVVIPSATSTQDASDAAATEIISSPTVPNGSVDKDSQPVSSNAEETGSANPTSAQGTTPSSENPSISDPSLFSGSSSTSPDPQSNAGVHNHISIILPSIVACATVLFAI